MPVIKLISIGLPIALGVVMKKRSAKRSAATDANSIFVSSSRMCILAVRVRRSLMRAVMLSELRQ
jgi:hypothetical protein